jgi:hypothetical protein
MTEGSNLALASFPALGLRISESKEIRQGQQRQKTAKAYRGHYQQCQLNQAPS